MFPDVPSKIATLPFDHVACEPEEVGCLQEFVLAHVPVPPFAGFALVLPPFQ
jgi:hypothetical protein